MELASLIKDSLESLENVKIFEALDLAELKNSRQVPAPAIYVVPASGLGGDNLRVNDVLQEYLDTVAVVMVVRSPNDPSGKKAADAIGKLRIKIKNNLLGKIFEHYEAVEYARGNITDVSNGYVWWQDLYKAKTYLSESED